VKTRQALALAVFLLVTLNACGAVRVPGTSSASGSRVSDAPAAEASPATGARTGCVMAEPTVTGPLVAGGSLPTVPSRPPSSALAVTFALGPSTSRTYIVKLLDLDGHVVASATANNRSDITGTCGNDYDMVTVSITNVSTSAGRVYYLDGDRDVRYVAPDGSTGLATRVTGNSQAVAMFAVSPDDRRIAVAIFDYRSKPIATRLYVEDLVGGRNRVELPMSFGNYWRPVGWHGGNLVLGGSTDTFPIRYGGLPLGPMESLQVMNPSNGRIVATFDDPSCRPAGSLPTHAGLACSANYIDALTNDWKMRVGTIDWSAKVITFSTTGVFKGGVSISPDGRYLLAGFDRDGTMKLISSPSTGGTVAILPGVGGFAGGGGWLDSTHVVIRNLDGGPNNLPPALLVVDIQTQSVTTLVERMALVGRLPGGL
jgi:hypothetical protein